MPLPTGWTEAYPNGIATNPDPVNGGIVDERIIDGLWFFVANADGKSGDDFPTRDAALEGLQKHLASIQ